MPGIPGTTGRPWYARELWASLMGVGVVLVAGVAAFVKEAGMPAPNSALLGLYVVGLAGGLVVGVVNVLRSHYRDKKDDKKDAPDDLRGCLHVILRVMCGYKGVVDPPDGWMRLTVHRVDGVELEQVVDYVGSGDRGSGRRLPVNAGLVGAVVGDRRKRPLVFSRPSSLAWDLWVEYLVESLKVPRPSALRTRADRYSFMAVPIRDPRGNIVAVVYADAGRPNFFDPVAQGIFLHGCIGLAHWINERYS